MDFFERQDKARRKTKWLVLYFTLSVALTILLIYAVFALIFRREFYESHGLAGLWNWQLFAGVTAGTLTVILIGNLTKIVKLSSGGGAVARMLGGRLISSDTTQPDERKLLNVVEEMAIASGTPVPEVYLLPDERGINAFAAGKSPQDAAVGVTQGCMRLLSRDELQGVIAHEFSHILNGDMRLNLRLIGIVHGLLCIAIVGRVLLQSSFYGHHRRHYSHYCLGARKKGANPLPLLGLALLIIGSIGMFFGRLIKAAVSREREYLADASAVQFTRHPQGIGNALKKIGGLQSGSRLLNPRAEEASHLFFGNGLKSSWLHALSTHPPLPDRIRAIDSTWDGKFPAVRELDLTAAQDTRKSRSAAQSSHRGGSAAAPPPLPDLLGGSARADGFMTHMGAPTSAHLDFAVMLLASLAEPLTAASRDPQRSLLLVYAMLLHEDEAHRAGQLESLSKDLSPENTQALKDLLPHVDKLPPQHRLPVLELSFPALRRLAPEDYGRFERQMQALIESDEELDLFEFALQKMVTRHLAPHFHKKPKRSIIQYYAIHGLLSDCAVLLSALSHVGHDDDATANKAFDLGVARLKSPPDKVPFLPMRECHLAKIDQALNRLDQAVPNIKKQVLQACLQTVGADGVIAAREAELLRAVADSLDCPIPPQISAAT